jgi:hypothetical protein
MRTSSKSGCELLPPILTAFAAALGITLLLVFQWQLVAVLYGSSLPVGLTLLWTSRAAPSPAERIAAVDAEHAERMHGDALAV